MYRHGIETAKRQLRRVRGTLHRLGGTRPQNRYPNRDDDARRVIALRLAGVWPKAIVAQLNVDRKFVERILTNVSYTYLERPAAYPPLWAPRTPEKTKALRKQRYWEQEKPRRQRAAQARRDALGVEGEYRPHERNLDRDRRIIYLRAQGVTPKEIAAQFQLKRHKVYNLLKKNSTLRRYLKRPEYPDITRRVARLRARNPYCLTRADELAIIARLAASTAGHGAKQAFYATLMREYGVSMKVLHRLRGELHEMQTERRPDMS